MNGFFDILDFSISKVNWLLVGCWWCFWWCFNKKWAAPQNSQQTTFTYKSLTLVCLYLYYINLWIYLYSRQCAVWSSHTSYQNFAKLTCLQPDLKNFDDVMMMMILMMMMIVLEEEGACRSLNSLLLYRYSIKIIIKKEINFIPLIFFSWESFFFFFWPFCRNFPRQIFRQNVEVLGIAI